jgi:hypothetical protein
MACARTRHNEQNPDASIKQQSLTIRLNVIPSSFEPFRAERLASGMQTATLAAFFSKTASKNPETSANPETVHE